MKKSLSLIIIFWAFSSKAQRLSTDDFHKAVDYVTCVCISEVENLKSNCIKSNIERANIKSGKKTELLYDELQLLKNEDPSDPITFLSEKIFNDSKKFKQIQAFADARKGSKIDEIKNSIKNYFDKENSVMGSDMAVAPPEDKKVELPIENVNDYIHSTSEKPSLYQYSLWDIILGFLICAIFFILSRLANAIKSLDKKFEKISRSNSSTLIQNYAPSSNSRIDKLEKKVDDLRIMIQDFKYKPILSETKSQETPNIIELKVPAPPAEEVFYMATPSDQNQFDDSARSESFRATQSLYKFTTEGKNKSLARFVFQSDASGVRDSVNYPHTYLEPVCDPQNALNQNAQKITTLKPGIAEKRNDKWIVTAKAQIIYE